MEELLAICGVCSTVTMANEPCRCCDGVKSKNHFRMMQGRTVLRDGIWETDDYEEVEFTSRGEIIAVRAPVSIGHDREPLDFANCSEYYKNMVQKFVDSELGEISYKNTYGRKDEECA